MRGSQCQGVSADDRRLDLLKFSQFGLVAVPEPGGPGSLAPERGEITPFRTNILVRPHVLHRHLLRLLARLYQVPANGRRATRAILGGGMVTWPP